MSVVRRELVDSKLVEASLEVLKIRHVAGGTNDGARTDRVKALNGLEAGEGAIRCFIGV